MAPIPQARIQALPRYTVSASPRVPVRFRASSNEHAAGPSQAVVKAILEAATTANRYPRPYGEDLADALADAFGVSSDEIAVDGGSHALLNHILLAFAGPSCRVVHSWRSFEAYPISVGATGALSVPIPNRRDGSHDLHRMLDAVDENTTALILCNPNNPTGVAFQNAELSELLERTPQRALVILDEAYVDFMSDPRAADASLSLRARHANLVILRTFSKCYGLAGLRVGYMLGHRDVVTAVRAVQPTFPISALAVAAAKAALHDTTSKRRTVASVHLERTLVTEALREMGYECGPSEANFVWLPLGGATSEFVATCESSGILVRGFGSDGVRITVGQPGLADALRHALSQPREWSPA